MNALERTFTDNTYVAQKYLYMLLALIFGHITHVPWAFTGMHHLGPQIIFFLKTHFNAGSKLTSDGNLLEYTM